jgi:phospholipid N-methyltransferase
MRQQWADCKVFWREFRDAYHSTGAVLPSGRALSIALSRFVHNGERHIGESLKDSEMAVSERHPYEGRRILEVGPGTGAVTAQIVRSMRPDDRLILVERNEQFVNWLRRRLADDRALQPAADRITLVHSAIEELPDDEPFDLIISGLPLNNFTVENVEQILAKLRRLLAPTGTLSFFEYVAVRRVKSIVSRSADRERLRGISRIFRSLFGKHEVARDLVLANVPPAWVHHVRFGAGSKEQRARSGEQASCL